MDNYLASGASVLPEFRNNMDKFKKKLYVPVFKGDKILAKYPVNAGFLKIDVEGAELEVLQGLQGFLTEQQPIIILEILPVYTLENKNGSFRKSREVELIAFLHSLNYGMYRIDEKNLSITFLKEIPIHGNMDWTNYLFVPTQKQATIEAAFT